MHKWRCDCKITMYTLRHAYIRITKRGRPKADPLATLILLIGSYALAFSNSPMKSTSAATPS